MAGAEADYKALFGEEEEKVAVSKDAKAPAEFASTYHWLPGHDPTKEISHARGHRRGVMANDAQYEVCRPEYDRRPEHPLEQLPHCQCTSHAQYDSRWWQAGQAARLFVTGRMASGDQNASVPCGSSSLR